MTTFLLTYRWPEEQHGRPGQLVGARGRDSRVSRADSLVEALSPRAVADHRVSALAGSRERAESRFREGRGRSRDRQGSGQQVGAGRAHLRRVRALPGELSGMGGRQGAEPEDDHPADAAGAARGRSREEARRGLHREGALAVHHVRRLREPVSGGHRASADPDRRAARPRVERRRARESGRRLQSPRAARQHLGARLRPTAEVRRLRRRSRSSTRRGTTCWSGSDAPGAFEADYQKSMRSLFEILRARGVRFGVLSKERCTGDPAKRTGNEYMFQELATGNIAELKAAGPKKILTSCPHCVKTIGDDYRRFGYDVEIVHSAVFVDELLRDSPARAGARRACDLPRSVLSRPLRREGRRAAPAADEPRRRHRGAGAQSREPVLLRRRRRSAVRRQGRGARVPHQRRAVQAAARDAAPTPW